MEQVIESGHNTEHENGSDKNGLLLQLILHYTLT